MTRLKPMSKSSLVSMKMAVFPTVVYQILGLIRGHLSRDMTKQQSECAPSEDTDQPGHWPSLIRVFAVRLMGS